MVANGAGREPATIAAETEIASAPAGVPVKGAVPLGLTPKPPGLNQIYQNMETKFGDWRDDLVRDGYVVVKGAVPKERAEAYQDEMLTYLETFAGGLGFKRDDPSTILEKHLPVIHERGMIHGYGAGHETFCWNMRQESGVIDAFAKLYDTEDLIVSYDSINMQWPGRPTRSRTPHGPTKTKIPRLNIFPNGENDGGIMVLPGAHLMVEEYQAVHKDEHEMWSWTKEFYGFTDVGLEWLESKGLKWTKVNAEAGDLILWDSRTPHYNIVPQGKTPRFCIYTCYAPMSEISPEFLAIKQDAFLNSKPTSHWPNGLNVIPNGAVPVKRDGEECPHNQWKPRAMPVLSERGYKLTGITYIQVGA
ncbi:hypothetical protein LTR53_010944 [Teratosphaeriaceae sp. CCFEE 6253]|nr:hypothetical protein LTR53_010944 [Teratosphaeriaceae sp. CCFEE 6253]